MLIWAARVLRPLLPLWSGDRRTPGSVGVLPEGGMMAAPRAAERSGSAPAVLNTSKDPGGSPMASLSDQQISQKLEGISGWKRNDLEGKPGITKVVPTGDFLSGLGFVTRIAVLAEKVNHHPDIVLTYPKVTVHLTTHSASGLTQRDFDLAAQIDQLT
jgi:4a-hydroxytetrahydrobiopterin dehydratase